MTETTEHATLDKLMKLIDSGEMKIFDAREVATIRRMITTYEAFESFGKLANAVRGIVIWLGVMLAAYFAFTGWLTKFIRSLAGN